MKIKYLLALVSLLLTIPLFPCQKRNSRKRYKHRIIPLRTRIRREQFRHKLDMIKALVEQNESTTTSREKENVKNILNAIPLTKEQSAIILKRRASYILSGNENSVENLRDTLAVLSEEQRAIIKQMIQKPESNEQNS